jgi:hypothetical protein
MSEMLEPVTHIVSQRLARNRSASARLENLVNQCRLGLPEDQQKLLEIQYALDETTAGRPVSTETKTFSHDATPQWLQSGLEGSVTGADAQASVHTHENQTHSVRSEKSALYVSNNAQFKSAAQLLAGKSDSLISKHLRG